jgi:S-adenosylmethionine hydrolase
MADGPRPCGVVTLTTDFGLADGYVGQMKGVMLGIDRTLALVDISHEIPPQAVATGGLLLAAAAGAFPPGTVHLFVVDPGVGTERAPMLAMVGDAWFVGPDNGGWSALARAAESAGRPVAAWRLTAASVWRPSVSATFHGRDIFAPVAAHLARGARPEALGVPLARPIRLPEPTIDRARGRSVGRVAHLDRFGNAITDLTPADLPAAPADCAVECGAFRAEPIARTYADAGDGEPVAVIGSFGALELARRNGNAAATWALAPGLPVVVAARRVTRPATDPRAGRRPGRRPGR